MSLKVLSQNWKITYPTLNEITSTMKKIAFFFVLTLQLFGCSTEQPNPEGEVTALNCNVKDPINDLPWLKSIVDDLKVHGLSAWGVKLVSYNKVEYIMVVTVWSSSPESGIYTCSGEQAVKTLNVSYNEFMDNAKTVRVLYAKN